jgi:hypothetical protein
MSVIITLMMEAASTSKTTVNFYHTTRFNNPEDNHLRFRKVLWFCFFQDIRGAYSPMMVALSKQVFVREKSNCQSRQEPVSDS